MTEPRVLASTWLALDYAALCLDEDETVFDGREGQCPACGGEHFALLARWLTETTRSERMSDCDERDGVREIYPQRPADLSDTALRQRANRFTHGIRHRTLGPLATNWLICGPCERCKRAYVEFLALRDAARAEQRERCNLYREAVTILLECDHSDEKTCGCCDRANERLVAIRSGR